MDAEVYLQVKSRVKKLLNIDLNYYKEDQVKRRLDSWLARNNMANWEMYNEAISKNASELARFRDFLTINVTEFLRDISYWKTLQDEILPLLIKKAEERKASLKIWSAGCSIGVEAYSLVMAVNEVKPGSAFQILASDMDRGALQKAKARGPYLPDEIRNLTPQQKIKYLDLVEDKFYFKQQYANSVQFFEQDLLLDEFGSGFDLIVCRNVVIYFTREAKDMLYQKFCKALRPDGILFVGGTEMLPRPSEYGLVSVSNRMSFYVKGSGDLLNRKISPKEDK